jgi:hypothetical protein
MGSPDGCSCQSRRVQKRSASRSWLGGQIVALTRRWMSVMSEPFVLLMAAPIAIHDGDLVSDFVFKMAGYNFAVRFL